MTAVELLPVCISVQGTFKKYVVLKTTVLLIYLTVFSQIMVFKED